MSREELDIQIGDIVAARGKVRRTYTSRISTWSSSVEMVEIDIDGNICSMAKSTIVALIERKETLEAKIERLEARNKELESIVDRFMKHHPDLVKGMVVAIADGLKS
jgi:seryl-tRNA synthetase